MFHVPAHKNVLHPAGQVSNPRVAPFALPDMRLNVQSVEDRAVEFVQRVQRQTNEYTAKNFPTLNPDILGMPLPWGGKFIRVVRESQCGSSRSVHCFIDRSNGDILKAAGWKSPAKHARGNIFADDHGMSCMDPYGPKYLR